MSSRDWHPSEHKKIRSTCKKCKVYYKTGDASGKNKHTRNNHRFHGFGSFEETHPGYCSRKACGSQDDPTVYRMSALKRKRKTKYSKSCCK